MKAVVLDEVGKWPVFTDYKAPQAEKGRCVVKLTASGLNRRDYYICKGLYPGIDTPIILGSDGVGEYDNRRILINPGWYWNDESPVQPDQFQVLGMPENGTFAEFIALPEEYIYDCPRHLSDIEAACLPLAGMTAYRALFTRAALSEADKVLITGIGGGVALLAMQLALANGNEVYITSGDQSKIDKAIALGASGGVNYNEKDWPKHLSKMSDGLFDVVVDSAGGDGFAELVKLTAPGGRIVLYGGTRGKWNEVSPQVIFWRQISILGSTMASAAEFSSMLGYVTKHEISPIVDRTYPLSEGPQALQYLGDHAQFGKIVLTHT